MLTTVRTSMLSLVQVVVRPVVASTTIGRHLSSSENSQNSKPIIKNNNIFRVVIDFQYKQKLATTCKTFSMLNTSAAAFQDEIRDFMAVFPDVIEEFADKIAKYDARLASKWYTKVLEYNVPGGKKTRGALIGHIFKSLASNVQLTPKNIKQAHYLGWCVELLQATFLILDDIIDGSSTRRGKICWHKFKNVGLTAINDAAMVESVIYSVLRDHFRQADFYTDVLELFNQSTLITTSGASLDILASKENVTNFTMDMYNTLARNKSGYYSFYLPFALAMRLAGVNDGEMYRMVEKVLIKMGTFFQIQDDFLDCFGDPQVTGKIGTDIQDNKCSWLAVVCMQRANADQKKIMVECYGQNDPVKIALVKELYVKLGIPNVYASYEEGTYTKIKADIQQISSDVLQELILSLLDRIYRRDS